MDPKSLKFASSLNSTDGAETDRFVCVHGRSFECLQRRVLSVIVKSGLLEAGKKIGTFRRKQGDRLEHAVERATWSQWSAQR
jgi:hypothetical protein